MEIAITLVRCQNRTKEESPRKFAYKMKAVVNSKLYYGEGGGPQGNAVREWTALLLVRPPGAPSVTQLYHCVP